jgi:hypothetical protein
MHNEYDANQAMRPNRTEQLLTAYSQRINERDARMKVAKDIRRACKQLTVADRIGDALECVAYLLGALLVLFVFGGFAIL